MVTFSHKFSLYVASATVFLGMMLACVDPSPDVRFGVLEIRSFSDSGSDLGKVYSHEELSNYYKNKIELFDDPAYFQILSAEPVKLLRGKIGLNTGKPVDEEPRYSYQVYVEVHPDGLTRNRNITFGDFTSSVLGHQVIFALNGEVLDSATINARLPPVFSLMSHIGPLTSRIGPLAGPWAAEDLVDKLRLRVDD